MQAHAAARKHAGRAWAWRSEAVRSVMWAGRKRAMRQEGMQEGVRAHGAAGTVRRYANVILCRE